MQYINKDANSLAGNQITMDYLNAIKIPEPGGFRYPVDYEDSFRNLVDHTTGKSYFTRMAEELIHNQKHYCCYCMRRIESVGDITLEHIMPQSLNNLYRNGEIDKLQEKKYYYRKSRFLVSNKIKLSAIFSKTINPIFPPFPHTVAYNNLVASCFGKFPFIKVEHNKEIASGENVHSCNNVRGVKNAFPIYYLPDILNQVIYLKDGGMIASSKSSFQSEIEDVINSANLTCQSMKDIRQMWYLFKNKVTLYQVKNCPTNIKERKKLLEKVLINGRLSQKRYEDLLQKFLNPDYWKTLMLYDWFYNYNWK